MALGDNVIYKIPYNVVFLQFFDKFLVSANIDFVCNKDDRSIFAKVFDFFCPFELHVCHAVRAIKRFQLVFIMKFKHVTYQGCENGKIMYRLGIHQMSIVTQQGAKLILNVVHKFLLVFTYQYWSKPEPHLFFGTIAVLTYHIPLDLQYPIMSIHRLCHPESNLLLWFQKRLEHDVLEKFPSEICQRKF